MRVVSVVGARPQFIKAAVVSRALAQAGVGEILVHTGQHYDARMSEIFFHELGLREPDVQLGIGSGTHGLQIGRMLEGLERVLLDVRPDRVLVYGDTNSTLAGALAAAKLQIPIDHVEAGLRSFDRDMPEEINRVVADGLAEWLFCPTRTAVANLISEGLGHGARFVGDVMLDLVEETRPAAMKIKPPDGLEEGQYFFATLHRPSNTDRRARLREVIGALDDVAAEVAPVILPVHPRLAARFREHDVTPRRVRCTEPTSYLDTQALIVRSRGVITDSGGVQKEALFHGVRCATLRDSTEWVESLEDEMNVLIRDALSRLSATVATFDGRRELGEKVRAAFGGGSAGTRIAQLVLRAGRDRRRWTRQVTGGGLRMEVL
jgi:UDP-N-acetylglucosamine 2-epimerase